MNDASIAVLVWCVLALHLAVGIVVRTRRSDLPLLPLLNLVVALCIVGYWIPRWYSYAAKGIAWHATDQLVPLYAILVCLLSGFALAGRYRGMLPHWVVFGVDAAVLVAFAIYMTTVRFDRMF